MKIAPKILLPCLLFLAAIFSACTNNAADNSNAASPEQSNSQISSANKNANQTKDNVEVLMTIINLPLEPEETVWRETVPNNPNSETPNSSSNKKKLTAVLRFSAVDAEKTVLQAQSYQPPSSVQIQTEDWFPAELIAQSELSGDETLKGTSYAANDFIQTPFTGGQIIRIENSNYFILELASE
ncbi:MAG: hypothetical protein M3Q99_16570 [Acidobacteriota bacterium]|nr:hypothetical protein [Acidobacteriota bacterium]